MCFQSQQTVLSEKPAGSRGGFHILLVRMFSFSMIYQPFMPWLKMRFTSIQVFMLCCLHTHTTTAWEMLHVWMFFPKQSENNWCFTYIRHVNTGMSYKRVDIESFLLLNPRLLQMRRNQTKSQHETRSCRTQRLPVLFFYFLLSEIVKQIPDCWDTSNRL